MPQEIERKFRVKGDFKPYVESSTKVMQGYLSSVPERIVRIRINGNQGFITIKGINNAAGLSRYEWEKEITVIEAKELLTLCEQGVINKIRHLVKSGAFTFEIDEFLGDNQGLVVAEIELKSETDEFVKPAWLGEEITGQEKYYNSRLSKKPFITW